MNRTDPLILLRTALNNPKAQFRAGQSEAIQKLTIDKQKLLVVQRTGWGKSSVYFISAKILRDQGKGPAIIISPLLALMRNQIEAAERLGIKAVSINSTNYEVWSQLKTEVLEDRVDAVLISPERLANERFVEEVLYPIADKIGLFVVDEAHCISDWGHDFRPDYRRIVGILKVMPAGMPILGTTATANDRVVDDIREQLGGIHVIRGSLTRESLRLQNIVLPDQASRLAWLTENIPKMEGSGIVYVLTKKDARIVAEWLIDAGIDAAAYYSGVEDPNFEDSNGYREYLEDMLYNNELKVLVASTALGMGYDKPDLSFVVHYQAPGSIIAYYQQVGRAGRAIDRAYGILLSGQEDGDVHRYFRESAFPSEAEVKMILKIVEEHDGLSVPGLTKELNMKQGQINKALKYLSVEQPSPIVKVGSEWKRAAVEYRLDSEKIERLTNQRYQEWQKVQEYIATEKCLMAFLQQELDDPHVSPCGKCANCLEQPAFPDKVAHSHILEASIYLKHSEFEIQPRKIITGSPLPEYGWNGRIDPADQAEIGRVLSRWGDAGWGKIVADDKHAGYFRDELVDAMCEMIMKRWHPDPFPEWVTCIPSFRHPHLVPDFAKRLAEKLNIPFKPVIVKVKDNEPQKRQENSFHQCHNLDGVFQISGEVENKPVFLVDDAIDSGWTFTIATILLKNSGAGLVYPVALTSTSVSD